MLTIGLTGGIGSGKSAVATLFAKLKIDIIDTDILARELVEPNMPAWQQIIKHFGDNILDKNNNIKRDKLRRIIFQNPDEKTWLEALLHPLIRKETKNRIKTATSPYCIVVIPLLVESKPNSLIKRILVVDTSEKLQLERTIKRDKVTRDEAMAIINSQTNRQERLAVADDVIENLTDFASLEKSVLKLHTYYLDLVN